MKKAIIAATLSLTLLAPTATFAKSNGNGANNDGQYNNGQHTKHKLNVTEDAFNRLKNGMSRKQVEKIFGTDGVLDNGTFYAGTPTQTDFCIDYYSPDKSSVIAIHYRDSKAIIADDVTVANVPVTPNYIGNFVNYDKVTVGMTKAEAGAILGASGAYGTQGLDVTADVNKNADIVIQNSGITDLSGTWIEYVDFLTDINNYSDMYHKIYVQYKDGKVAYVRNGNLLH